MIAFALAFALAANNGAVALEEGEAAPFVGVLLTNDRATELALVENEVGSCRAQLAASANIIEQWKAVAAAPPQQAPLITDPTLNWWIGFGAGVGLTVGSLAFAAWALTTASNI